jgi:UDP-glucose 4-epimerase
MRVLVTGGAGYVGSVTVELLVAEGHQTTVVDSLATGHRAAVAAGAELVVGSVADRSALTGLLRERRIEAILHCAARSLVGESVRDPSLYYRENVVGGVALLEAAHEARVDRVVFSSTAAVYGEPSSVPISEDEPLRPINPYGETKRAFEGALRWYGEAHGLRSVALRYFNAAGATRRYGEDHRPETHLIPRVLTAIRRGEPVTIFGDDYPTPDGTCIRDYIHVSDLAAAHLAALTWTEAQPPGFTAINLGSGSGSSVREVLAVAARVTGRTIPQKIGPRREGDPPVLLASNVRARELLGWAPTQGSLDAIIGSAWAWRTAHPDGYPDD